MANPEAGEIILKAGVEGGDITLLGIKTGDAWQFLMTTDASTIYDLLNEEDRPAEYLRKDWVRDSDWISGWDAALEPLDRYPWYKFYPLQVHPDFKQVVLEAVVERFNNDSRGDEHGSLERWQSVSGEGDD